MIILEAIEEVLEVIVNVRMEIDRHMSIHLEEIEGEVKIKILPSRLSPMSVAEVKMVDIK